MSALEHRRARIAFETVGAVNNPDYKSVVDSAPTLLHSSGLLQVLAFYHSRKPGRPEHDLAEQILDWLAQESELTKRFFDGQTPAFKALLAMPPMEIALCEEEALHFVAWLKRFADAKWQKPAQTAEATSVEDGRRPKGN